MRWLVVLLVGIAILVGIVFVGGLLLPVHHVAVVRAHIPAPQESVYAALRDAGSGAAWRQDVDSVRILSAEGEPLRWQEWGGFGALRFVRAEEREPSRIVSRIDGTEQGFGGSWTWELRPAGNGATDVTVTENGEVYSPPFRFLSRFVFGHYGTMESYVRDLGRRFGADVRAEHVTP